MAVLQKVTEYYIGLSNPYLEAAHGLQISEHHARVNLHTEAILRATQHAK